MAEKKTKKTTGGYATTKAAKLLDAQVRVMCRQMAVNCRISIAEIEKQRNWKKDRKMCHWHGILNDVRDLCLQKAPEPPRIEPDLSWLLPAEAPPTPVDVSDIDKDSGSVGSGRTSRTGGGHADAPPTHTVGEELTDWEEVYGRQ